MNRGLKIFLVVLIVAVVGVGAYFGWRMWSMHGGEATARANDFGEERVVELAKNKYPNHEVVSVEMQKKGNKGIVVAVTDGESEELADRATVIVEGDSDRRTLRFKRFMLWWTLDSDESDSTYNPLAGSFVAPTG